MLLPTRELFSSLGRRLEAEVMPAEMGDGIRLKRNPALKMI